MNAIKHQIWVNGKLVDAKYATKEIAEDRVKIAQSFGMSASYAGTVSVVLPSFCL